MLPDTRPAATRDRSPLVFFALVVLLFLPFPVLAAVVHVPGLPKNAPVTDFFLAFVPTVAAVVLVYRAEGAAGVRRLLRRAVDLGRGPHRLRWLLAAVLLPVVSLAATYGLMAVTGWEFQRQPALSVTTMLVFLVVFPLAAAGEEIGWSGYVTEPLVARFGALGGTLVLALPWWGLHVPSILVSGQDTTLIVIGFFGSLAFRVLWGWLFLNTGGSVATVIVVHAVTNVCASYVPSVPTSANAPVLVALAVLVTLLWGPRTLRRLRVPGRRG